MFVHTARYIKLINSAGVRKVRRNMLAIQQSLRGISQSQQEGVLQLSNIYWDMYDQNPKVSAHTCYGTLIERISWRR